MLQKLEAIKRRWEDVGRQITDPEVIADRERYIKLSKEYKNLQEIEYKYKT